MQRSGLFRQFARLPLILAVLLCPALVGLDPPAAGAQPAPGPCAEGERLYRAAKFAEARTAFRLCLDTDGPSLAVLLPLVVMGVQQDRLPEAVQYGEAAVGLAPTDAEARYWYGRALLRSDRPAEAKQQWEAGLAVKVDHLGILEGMARLALAENETAKAYQLLSQMQRQGLQAPWLDRMLAEIAASKRLWAQSLAHLQDAMAQEEGGNAEDLLSASELSILSGDKAGAVAYCRRAVALEPGPATWGGLGEAYFSAQQVDSALVFLRMAVAEDPTRTRFRFNLANALEISGLTEESDLHFGLYVEQVPRDPVGRFNYAIHLEKMGRTAEALVQIDQAVALDPGMLTARVVRSQLLEGLGRWDEALAEVGELQQRDQANAKELALWRERLLRERDLAQGNALEGKVHLLHMVLGTPELLAQVQAELADGADFSSLVVRYSTGPAAARGGDVGWVDPGQMVGELGAGIARLGVNEISPPMESKGLYHIFKRIP